MFDLSISFIWAGEKTQHQPNSCGGLLANAGLAAPSWPRKAAKVPGHIVTTRFVQISKGWRARCEPAKVGCRGLLATPPANWKDCRAGKLQKEHFYDKTFFSKCSFVARQISCKHCCILLMFSITKPPMRSICQCVVLTLILKQKLVVLLHWHFRHFLMSFLNKYRF